MPSRCRVWTAVRRTARSVGPRKPRTLAWPKVAQEKGFVFRRHHAPVDTRQFPVELANAIPHRLLGTNGANDLPTYNLVCLADGLLEHICQREYSRCNVAILKMQHRLELHS